GDNNDNVVGTFVQGYSADAIQEFEGVTDQYKAEYGRASHGVVNVITKSGTNAFNGTAFGLYRNESFRQKNFAQEEGNSPKADSERKQGGFSIGGPILKDKLFFFGSYERIEEDSPIAYGTDLTGFNRTSSLAGQTFDQSLARNLYTAKINFTLNGNNTFFVR